MTNDKKFITKNGLQAQNLSLVDSISNESHRIDIEMLSSDTISFSGDSGQLFSITDSLTGTIFSVNDISGIPSIEVDDDGTIRFAEFAGNVLIGTATDNGADRLQVNGSVSVTGNISLNDKLVHNGNTNTSVRFPTNDTVTIETSGAEAFRVDSTGRVGIGTSSPSVTLDVNGDFSATTITETSSIQLKSHIEPITNAISTIESLFGVNYIRKSSGKREVGLIAEDVELILPEIVDTRGEYKSISYGRLTAYLIEAIKSLKTELDEIKKNNGQS